MKKYMSIITSSAFAVLAFIFYALPTFAESFVSLNGYETITFEGSDAWLTIYSIFSIILLIAGLVAVLLSVLGVVLGKDNLSKFAKYVIYGVVACAVVALISAIVLSNRFHISIGVGPILVLVAAIAAMVTNLLVKE